MFEEVPTIVAQERVRHPRSPRSCAATSISPSPENKQLLAKNIFVFGQCMEGTQFYGLFGMILSLYRQNKFPGIGQMFRYTLRDESNHIEVFRQSVHGSRRGEPRDLDRRVQARSCAALMREAVALEKEFIRDCLPVERASASAPRISRPYIDYIADRRLEGVGLAPLQPRRQEPAAVARRDDGHQEGAELLRGSRHRIPKSLLPQRRRTTTSSRVTRSSSFDRDPRHDRRRFKPRRRSAPAARAAVRSRLPATCSIGDRRASVPAVVPEDPRPSRLARSPPRLRRPSAESGLRMSSPRTRPRARA